MTADWWSGLWTGVAIGMALVPLGWFGIPLVVHEVRRWHRGT